jgi:hypothetical protein
MQNLMLFERCDPRVDGRDFDLRYSSECFFSAVCRYDWRMTESSEFSHHLGKDTAARRNGHTDAAQTGLTSKAHGPASIETNIFLCKVSTVAQ